MIAVVTVPMAATIMALVEAVMTSIMTMPVFLVIMLMFILPLIVLLYLNHIYICCSCRGAYIGAAVALSDVRVMKTAISPAMTIQKKFSMVSPVMVIERANLHISPDHERYLTR